MENFSLFDEWCMKQALIEAQKAFEKDEVPVGAVLALENTIIAQAHNLIETNQNATDHAEILCIREGAKILSDWRLVNTTLYVTLEPCIMCSGAIILSRIKKVIWGCRDFRHGGAGSLVDLFSQKHPIHQPESVGGLFAEEAKVLMQTFFQHKRERHRDEREHRRASRGADLASEKEGVTGSERNCPSCNRRGHFAAF